MLNFDTDLSDGLALGALMISHIPRLAFLSAQLNLAPTTPAAQYNNATIVIKMTVEIQLPWQLQVPPCCLLHLHVLQLLSAPLVLAGPYISLELSTWVNERVDELKQARNRENLRCMGWNEFPWNCILI